MCGQVRIKERKDGKWDVYAYDHRGGKPQNTTVLSQRDAQERSEDYFTGWFERHPEPSVAPTRKSSRSVTQTFAAIASDAQRRKRADTTTAKYVAGPGEGHHVKVNDRLRQTIAAAIDKLTDHVDNPSDRTPTDIARSLGQLHAHLERGVYHDEGEGAVQRIIKHQSAQTGERCKRKGKSKRTLRRVKQQIREEIAEYDIDVKIVILQEVLSPLDNSTKKRKRQDVATDFIIQNLQHSVSRLRAVKEGHIKKGRYKHQERVTMQNIAAATLCKVPGSLLSAAADVLGLRRQICTEMQKAWDAYEAGDRETIHDVHAMAPIWLQIRTRPNMLNLSKRGGWARNRRSQIRGRYHSLGVVSVLRMISVIQRSVTQSNHCIVFIGASTGTVTSWMAHQM